MPRGLPLASTPKRDPASAVVVTVLVPAPVYAALRRLAFEADTSLQALAMRGLGVVLDEAGGPTLDVLLREHEAAKRASLGGEAGP